ncbi:hypothetical protein VULLAG_LOCUS3589 [Vulpes lagopus]
MLGGHPHLPSPTAPRSVPHPGTWPWGNARALDQGAQGPWGRLPPEAPSHVWPLRNPGALQFRWTRAQTAEWVPPAQGAGAMGEAGSSGAGRGAWTAWLCGAGEPGDIQCGLPGPGGSSVHMVQT